MLGLVRAVDLIVDTRRQRPVQVFVLDVWVMSRLRVVYEQTEMMYGIVPERTCVRLAMGTALAIKRSPAESD